MLRSAPVGPTWSLVAPRLAAGPGQCNGRLKLGPLVFLATLDFEEGGYQVRIAA
jgi:hypothetical protein